jgi:hypothetical protein
VKFGALRVRRPDGIELDYEIDLPSTILGRAEGSGVAIDDRSISRRHARLTIDTGLVLIEDLGSANGTFLNGRRLPPNVPSIVDNSESIRLGDVDIRYIPADEVAAIQSFVHDEPPESTAPTQHIVVSLQATALTVEAGAAVSTQALIQNRGRIVDELTLGIEHVPPHWVIISHPALRLLPGEEATVMLTFQPPRLPEAQSGIYDFALTVKSTENELQEQANASLTVLPYFDASMAIRPLRAKRDFKLSAENRGNQLVTLGLAGADDEEAYAFRFETPALVLQPGEAKTITLQVNRAHRKLFGTQQVVPFQVIASPSEAGQDRMVVPGQVFLKPPLERFKRPARLLAVLLILLGAALAVYLIRKEDGKKKEATGEVAVATGEARYEGVHMCDKAKNAKDATSPTPVAFVPDSPAEGPKRVSLDPLGGFASAASANQQPAANLFAQNDPQWSKVEYAKAGDPKYGPDWCGTTLAQCGCAMTSVTNVMALFNLLVLPNDKPTNPQNINEWFNQDAKETTRGWVSRGYVYGDVIWTSVNQLSAEMVAKNPGAGRVRFSRFGSGSEEEVRAELEALRPVILEVPGHYIIAYGFAQGKGSQILIKDPYYPEKKFYDVYKGKVKSSVLFESNDDVSAVVFTIPSRQRIRITDNKGNVVGTLAPGANPAEAIKKAQVGIPGASIAYRDNWRDPTCVESAPAENTGTIQIVIPGALPNDYKVEVIDTEGEGTSLAIHSYDKNGVGQVNVESSPTNNTLVVNWPGGDADNSNPTDPTPDPGGGGGGGGGGGITITPVSPGTVSPASPGPSVAPSTGPSTTPATVTPTPPPTAVGIECTQATSGTPPIATVTCQAAITGPTTMIQWRLNGLLLGQFTGQRSFTTPFSSSATVQVAVTACNGSACKEAARAVAVKIGDSGPVGSTSPGPTATPKPGSNAPTGVELDCGLAFHRNPPSATVTCTTRFSGISTAINWLAPGASPATLEGNEAAFTGQVVNDQTLHVTVTVCNLAECADPVTVDLKVVVDPATTISFESCSTTTSTIDCLTAVSTSIGATSQWTISVPGYSQTLSLNPVVTSPVGIRLAQSLIPFRNGALSTGAISGAGVYTLTATLKVCKRPDQPDSCLTRSTTVPWAVSASVSIRSCTTPAGAGGFGCEADVFGVSGSSTQWALSVPGYSANFGPAGILPPGATTLTLSQALTAFRSAALTANAIQPGQTVQLTVTVTICAGTCASDSKTISWVV